MRTLTKLKSLSKKITSKIFRSIFLFIILYMSGILGGYIFISVKTEAIIQNETLKYKEETEKYYEEGYKKLMAGLEENKDSNASIKLKEHSDLDSRAKKSKDIEDNSKKINSDLTGVYVKYEDAFKKNGDKVAYLTFDDGPSNKVTPKVLKILDDYHIKATFFVIGDMAKENEDMIKKEYDKGHSIGNHSYTHEFSKVYSDEKNFEKELNDTDKILKSILGSSFNTRLFRFPGGSFEKSKEPYKNILKNKGMVYIDWNCLNGDAEGQNISADRLLNRVKETVENQEKIVILMHDAPAKSSTAEALPLIIEYLKSQGYRFAALR